MSWPEKTPKSKALPWPQAQAPPVAAMQAEVLQAQHSKELQVLPQVKAKLAEAGSEDPFLLLLLHCRLLRSCQ